MWKKIAYTVCPDCGSKNIESGCEEGHCDEGAGFHLVVQCSNPDCPSRKITASIKESGKVIDIKTRQVIDDTPTEGTPEEDPLEYLKRMTEPGALVEAMRNSLGDDFDRFRGITKEDINEGRVCHTTMRGCGFNKGYLNDPPERHPELAHPDCPMHGDEYRAYMAEVGDSMRSHPAGKGRLTLVPNEHDSHIKEAGLGDIWDSIKYHLGEAWENVVAYPAFAIHQTITDKLATHPVSDEDMPDHLSQGHGITVASTDSSKQMNWWHQAQHRYMLEAAERGRPMEHNQAGFGAEADRVEAQHQQRQQDAQEWAKNNPVEVVSSVQVHDVTDTGTSTEDLNTPEWDAKLRNADLYSKSAVIRAEKLTEDTPLTTTLADGHVETERTAPAGHYLVTNPGGEQYAVDPETFEKKYQPHPEEEGKYVPKGVPTPAVRIDKDMDITAPWGEAQHMRAGDYILGQPDSPDRYGIGKQEFSDTYGLDTVNYNVASVRKARVMSNEFNERTGSASYGLWTDEDDFEKEGGLLNDWANILPGFKSEEEKALESASKESEDVASGGTYTPIAQRPGYTPPKPSKTIYTPVTGEGTPAQSPSLVQHNQAVEDVIKSSSTSITERNKKIEDAINGSTPSPAAIEKAPTQTGLVNYDTGPDVGDKFETTYFRLKDKQDDKKMLQGLSDPQLGTLALERLKNRQNPDGPSNKTPMELARAASTLPEWIQEVIRKEAHDGLYPNDPEAQAYDMKEEEGRDRAADPSSTDDIEEWDPAQCGMCDEKQSDHCQSCGECPGEEHVGGCPDDKGAPVGKSPDDFDDSMDGDFDSGMASAGFGTDEDYGHFGGEDW